MNHAQLSDLPINRIELSMRTHYMYEHSDITNLTQFYLDKNCNNWKWFGQ